ncbi:DUF736 domain-containing protein [Hephaestia sp. GCM10023244]|uniref:DUF736 domain-containing protein n=1 Tax=unclassified Hephaestia TaxID=2631281 RepID=UPI002077216B|nr:DUF736 domain-containing protein [Hephaestia sp. MAHUQ-44]MCM8731964.1 DUF736 domain-containing protein [Hephaestia sp. MAHUQ-44]
MSNLFTLTKQGGWEGRILTLAIDRKVRLVPNDDRQSERSPDYIALMGWRRVGQAWKGRAQGDPPRDYLRVQFYDPTWRTPLRAALFPSQDGLTAELVWRLPSREPR